METDTFLRRQCVYQRDDRVTGRAEHDVSAPGFQLPDYGHGYGVGSVHRL
jgi:hypothetical protein